MLHVPRSFVVSTVVGTAVHVDCKAHTSHDSFDRTSPSSIMSAPNTSAGAVSSPAAGESPAIVDAADAPPFSLTVSQLSTQLRSNPIRGLSATAAAQLLAKHGPNSVPVSTVSFWAVFLEEVREPLILMLLLLGILYFVWGQLEEAITVCVIIAICILIEIGVEWKAKQAMLRLTSTTHHPDVLVTRGGVQHLVRPEHVVVGDLMHVNAGEQVVADGRVLSSTWLSCDESALTGESTSSHKDAAHSLPVSTPLHSRTNMLYAETLVTQGQGLMMVTATGARTYTGSLREKIRRTRPPPTPLQKAMKTLAFQLTAIAAIACVLVFVACLVQGLSYSQATLAVLSLAFATVPEELPILIKVVLAVGGMKMARVGVLVKSLKTAESLGGVGIMLTDKTGTLTENRLRVIDCVMKGEQSNGRLWMDVMEVWLLSSPAVLPQLKKLPAAGAVDASGVRDRFDSAVLLAASTAASSPSLHSLTLFSAVDALITTFSSSTVVNLLPFDPYRKRSSCIRRTASTPSLYCRGSAESVLSVSSHIRDTSGTTTRLTDEDKQALQQAVEKMAASGIRVLAFARRELSEKDLHNNDIGGDEHDEKTGVAAQEENQDVGDTQPETEALKTLESNLTFIGVIGFEDKVRAGVNQAIHDLQAAGITVKMITGDHLKTGEAIALQVGILSSSSSSPSASLVTTASSSLTPRCYCRMTPDDKLSLVTAHQASGHLVLVTGDGFNDSPALAAADVAMAMGETGTDMARQAAGLILVSDDFPAVVTAVREGRRLLDNLKKAIRFYLACKLTLILLFVLAVLGFATLPLLPLHVIILEAFMDLGASSAWTTEGGEEDRMKRKPEEWGRGKLMKGPTFWPTIVGGGVIMWLGVGGVFWWGWNGLGRDEGEGVVQTAVLLCWLVSHVLLAHAMRTFHRSIVLDALFTTIVGTSNNDEYVRMEEGQASTNPRLGVFSNLLLSIWTIGAIAFGVVSVSVPALRSLFELSDLSVAVNGVPVWVPAVVVPVVLFFVTEVVKFVYSKRLQ